MIEEEPEDDIGPEEVPLELAFGNANVDSDLSDDDDDGDDSDSEKEAKAKSPPSSPGKKGSKPSSPNKGARAGQEEGDGVLVEAEDAADLD